MSDYQLLAHAWDLKPSVIVGCAALLAGVRPVWRSAAWMAGIALLLTALISPLDTLADSYLFSAHMAKHMLLVLVIPALLLIGMPAGFFERALRHPRIAAVERVLRRPAVAWTAGVGSMIVWHIPALFNAALANEGLHIVEHLSLLAGGTIYWWPLLAPVPGSRISPVAVQIGYLFSSCFACTILGISITFARGLLYPAYAHFSGDLSPLVRNDWGISPALDQQIGGILMWVPGCLIYLTGIMATLARWYAAEQETVATYA